MTNAKKETKVFIAGSRRLSKLSREIKRRIDNIVQKHLTIIIGDANGADKAVQQYLSAKGYGDVIVFCMDGSCRNNLGNWATQEIKAASPGKRDFAYYSTKDRAMAKEADYGLMLWDGESRGTLTSIIQMVREAKPVVVFVAPDKAFYTLRDSSDLAKVSVHIGHADFIRIDQDLQSVNPRQPASRKQTDARLLF
jgi:hypothetical protein